MFIKIPKSLISTSDLSEKEKVLIMVFYTLPELSGLKTVIKGLSGMSRHSFDTAFKSIKARGLISNIGKNGVFGKESLPIYKLDSLKIDTSDFGQKPDLKKIDRAAADIEFLDNYGNRLKPLAESWLKHSLSKRTGPTPKKWNITDITLEFKRLMEKNKLSINQIRAISQVCFHDPFWSTNVISVYSLDKTKSGSELSKLDRVINRAKELGTWPKGPIKPHHQKPIQHLKLVDNLGDI